MPSQPIVFPANFTTASAMAYMGGDGSVQLVTTENPIPVTVSGGSGGSGLTDAQLRAAPVPVSLSSFGGLTDLQLRAAPVSVSLSSFSGLTEAQLRASPVSVSLSSFSGVTDTQLRASPLVVSPDAVADAVRTSGTATSAAVVVSASTAGFSGGSFHVTGAGTTCTITYEQSNDNVTWVALPVISLAAANAAPALTTTAAGLYGFATSAAYVRARVSTYGSGTVAVTLAQKRQAPPVNGVSLAGGSSALGSVTVSGTTNTGTGYTVRPLRWPRPARLPVRGGRRAPLRAIPISMRWPMPTSRAPCSSISRWIAARPISPSPARRSRRPRRPSLPPGRPGPSAPPRYIGCVM